MIELFIFSDESDFIRHRLQVKRYIPAQSMRFIMLEKVIRYHNIENSMERYYHRCRTALYNSVILYYTVSHCTMQCYTALCCVTLHYTVLHCTIQFHTALYSFTLPHKISLVAEIYPRPPKI